MSNIKAAMADLRIRTATTGELAEFHVRTLSVYPEAAFALEHRALFCLPHNFLEWETCIAPRTATAELVCRLVLQFQQAANRKPESQYFRHTSIMTRSKLASAGGLLIGELADFAAGEQKAGTGKLWRGPVYALPWVRAAPALEGARDQSTLCVWSAPRCLE